MPSLVLPHHPQTWRLVVGSDLGLCCPDLATWDLKRTPGTVGSVNRGPAACVASAVDRPRSHGTRSLAVQCLGRNSIGFSLTSSESLVWAVPLPAPAWHLQIQGVFLFVLRIYSPI